MTMRGHPFLKAVVAAAVLCAGGGSASAQQTAAPTAQGPTVEQQAYKVIQQVTPPDPITTDSPVLVRGALENENDKMMALFAEAMSPDPETQYAYEAAMAECFQGLFPKLTLEELKTRKPKDPSKFEWDEKKGGILSSCMKDKGMPTGLVDYFTENDPKVLKKNLAKKKREIEEEHKALMEGGQKKETAPPQKAPAKGEPAHNPKPEEKKESAPAIEPMPLDNRGMIYKKDEKDDTAPKRLWNPFK